MDFDSSIPSKCQRNLQLTFEEVIILQSLSSENNHSSKTLYSVTWNVVEETSQPNLLGNCGCLNILFISVIESRWFYQTSVLQYLSK